VVINNFYFSSEATQKWLGITVKILKVLAYMLTFLVVLGTAVITRHACFIFELRQCYWAMLAFFSSEYYPWAPISMQILALKGPKLGIFANLSRQYFFNI
jgi:hypothetical protein